MTKSILSVATLFAVVIAGCASSPKTADSMDELNKECEAAMASFKEADPEIEPNFFNKAYGYAVIAGVAKGGLVVGGAHGKGQVYKSGKLVGYTTLSQGSIGAQIGGQVYDEVIFFQNETAYNNFIDGEFALAAQASAVAVKAGASAEADYDNGVAIFVVQRGGLMAEASVGGQNFTFESVEAAQEAMAKDS